MTSIVRAPDFVSVGDFNADRLLDNLKKGDGIVCNGYEYLNILVLPHDGASVDAEIGYWTDDLKNVSGDKVGGFIRDVDSPKKTAITTPIAYSIPVRGRNAGIGLEISGGSVQLLVSGFKLVSPD